MSAAKHTPGPWSVEDFGTNCLLISGNVPQEGCDAQSKAHFNRIASVTQRDAHPYHGGGIDRDTTMANARLIAAAPLMKELCDFVRDNAFYRKWDGDERAFNMLAAIAKATGSAS